MADRESSTVALYKVLRDGASCHGGAMVWPLPTQNEDGLWEPGAWVEIDGPLMLCERALHLTDQPAGWYLPDAQCWRAEHRGETVGELDGQWQSKIGVASARLLAPVTWDAVSVWTEGDHSISTGIGRASGSASVRASDSATVRAFDSARVEAFDSATVRAYGSATVRAYGSATVRAFDSARVEAFDSARVRASGSARVRASDSARVEAFDSARVEASDSARVEASGSATVEASGSATVRAFDSATVRAYDSATVKAYDSATVRASDSATCISDRWHSESAQVALKNLAAHVDRRGDVLVLRSAEARP